MIDIYLSFPRQLHGQSLSTDKKVVDNESARYRSSAVLTCHWRPQLGLVGLFSSDLVRAILGDMTFLSRIVYILVGVSGFCTKPSMEGRYRGAGVSRKRRSAPPVLGVNQKGRARRPPLCHNRKGETDVRKTLALLLAALVAAVSPSLAKEYDRKYSLGFHIGTHRSETYWVNQSVALDLGSDSE